MYQDGINPQRKMLRTPAIRYLQAHVQETALTVRKNMPMQMREKDEIGGFHLHLGSSPGLGQEVYFWTHGTFPHTLSWGVVFWILTLVPICSYNLSVPQSRNLECFSCTRNKIWNGWIFGNWSNTWLVYMVQRHGHTHWQILLPRWPCADLRASCLSLSTDTLPSHSHARCTGIPSPEWTFSSGTWEPSQPWRSSILPNWHWLSFAIQISQQSDVVGTTDQSRHPGLRVKTPSLGCGQCVRGNEKKKKKKIWTFVDFGNWWMLITRINA